LTANAIALGLCSLVWWLVVGRFLGSNTGRFEAYFFSIGPVLGILTAGTNLSILGRTEPTTPLGAQMIAARGRMALRDLLLWLAIAAVGVPTLAAADWLVGIATTPESAQQRYGERSFAVLTVIDGDTFEIDVADGDRGTSRVSLLGVNAPGRTSPHEVPHGYAASAARLTSELLQGVEVRLESIRRDRYGRLRAYVILPDGRMLNRVLIEGGHAYADTRDEHPLREEFVKHEADARSAKRGLWADDQFR
jgi:micrococcal nuclease